MMNFRSQTISNMYLFIAEVAGLSYECICIDDDVICGTRVRILVGIKGTVRTGTIVDMHD